MKSLLAIAACLLFAHAARGEGYTVRVQETAIIEIAGATAVFTTNPAIADVTIASAGRLSVTGRSSGTTQLVVITAGGSQTFLITVAAPVLPPVTRTEAGAPLGRYEGRYASGSGQMQNTFDLVTHDGQRTSQIHVLHVHDLRAGPGQPADAIASIFYRVTTPTRRLTLLDETVDLSRMTISNTSVRGLHLKEGPLELHAGYASSTMFDDFFLPAGRRWVGGAGYGIDRGSTRWTPSVYGFFSQPAGTAARRGVVGALSAEHRDGDTLFLRGDVGVSRSMAASGEVRYTSLRNQFRALASMKPSDFPNLGLADIPRPAPRARLEPPRHEASVDHLLRHIRSVQAGRTAPNDRCGQSRPRIRRDRTPDVPGRRRRIGRTHSHGLHPYDRSASGCGL